jgi:hypothetical protein
MYTSQQIGLMSLLKRLKFYKLIVDNIPNSWQEVVFGRERTVNKSLNTGVVSLNRNSRWVPQSIDTKTVATEDVRKRRHFNAFII